MKSRRTRLAVLCIGLALQSSLPLGLQDLEHIQARVSSWAFDPAVPHGHHHHSESAPEHEHGSIGSEPSPCFAITRSVRSDVAAPSSIAVVAADAVPWRLTFASVRTVSLPPIRLDPLPESAPAVLLI